MTEQSSIRYGDARITYSVRIRPRDNGKVLIKVHADGSVVAHAPLSASAEEVSTAVRQRARWIWNQVETFRQQREQITPRQYVSGESHYYLGKQYVLKVIEDQSAPADVKLLQGRLQVTVREKSAKRVKGYLHDWYKNKAQEVFQRRLDAVLPQALWVAERPGVRLKTMQTRWGSCSPGQTLTLNPHLVKAPRDCIDYVLLHELCHIAEHNHSERFYRLLSQVLPNWATVKKRLDTRAEVFLNDV
jgi:predicted metal-dependent hydrolase